MFRMVRNRWSRAVLATAGFLVLSASAWAQAKVAIINMQRAVVETAEIKKAQAELAAKFRPRQEAMEKLQQELQSIQQQLQAGAGKLSPQAEQELTIQGQRKQREYQRITEDLQADVDAERNDILARTSQRMQEVVSKLAEEKGLDVIIDVGNAVYFKPALDVTDEVIVAYDKAYPAQ